MYIRDTICFTHSGGSRDLGGGGGGGGGGQNPPQLWNSINSWLNYS